MQKQIWTLRVKPDRQHCRRPWRRANITTSSTSFDCIVLSGQLLDKIAISHAPAPLPHHPLHPPSLRLKVTLPVCQSLAMTPALSVIHHVSCVSARCRTSWAVGGLSSMLALYNMQIITCKLPTNMCDDISVLMQMQTAIRSECVCVCEQKI